MQNNQDTIRTQRPKQSGAFLTPYAEQSGPNRGQNAKQSGPRPVASPPPDCFGLPIGLFWRLGATKGHRQMPVFPKNSMFFPDCFRVCFGLFSHMIRIVFACHSDCFRMSFGLFSHVLVACGRIVFAILPTCLGCRCVRIVFAHAPDCFAIRRLAPALPPGSSGHPTHTIGGSGGALLARLSSNAQTVDSNANAGSKIRGAADSNGLWYFKLVACMCSDPPACPPILPLLAATAASENVWRSCSTCLSFVCISPVRLPTRIPTATPMTFIMGLVRNTFSRPSHI